MVSSSASSSSSSASLMLAMSRPTFTAISQSSTSSIVFVPSRKQCRLTAVELLGFCAAEGLPKKFLNCTSEELEP